MSDLDQEKMATKSVANGNFAPAYRAIRTDRYLYVLYANGQSELYDMRRDPGQLRNLAANPRLSGCASGCTATWSASRPAPARAAGPRSDPIPRR